MIEILDLPRVKFSGNLVPADAIRASIGVICGMCNGVTL